LINKLFELLENKKKENFKSNKKGLNKALKKILKELLLENNWKNLTSKIISSNKSKHSKHCGFTIKLFSFFGHDFFCEFHNKVK